MSDWTAEELDLVSKIEEVEVTPAGADGAPLQSVVIWAVTDGSDVFVRSVHGQRARWWKQAEASGRATFTADGVVRDVTLEHVSDIRNQAVSDAYNHKYAAQPAEFLRPMVEGESLTATFRVVPVA
ncbi:MAG: DUF2255 family protein [Microbacteriaceae bacterium]|nr:DUF2255 family protein [Microbacteriaceae bacterium]MCL2793964.1 DUF2255 family protein [Microbacteriaceae bacterium]